MSAQQVQQQQEGDYTPSPSHTVVDYDATVDPIPKTLTQSSNSDSIPHPEKSAAPTLAGDVGDPIPVLSQRRKWALLMVFSLGFMVDILMYSAFCKSQNVAPSTGEQ